MKRQAMMMKKTGDEEPKQKERHIVTWTQQEDDILREQIRIHGTENWTIIASKFKDKTTRQCRRRWYTYLNSDFKKGGWSLEEDMILCEAQKVFGNRWTEIAKVVSGRTDNAVKNRFSTLCKKRAKHEALAKENANSCNKTNKRVLIQNGDNTDTTSDIAGSLKRMRRSHIPVYPNSGGNLLAEYGNAVHQQMRSPFSVLVQNFHNVNSFAVHHHVDNVKEASNDAQSNKIQGTFLRKDDPKIAALMQQAELLSSLAVKVNKENTDQSLENAWKALQDFLDESKESDMPRVKFSDMDFQLEDFKDLVDDLRSNEQGPPSWRQPDLYEESSASSEYSSGSSLLSQTTADKMEQIQAEYCGVQQDTGVGLQTVDPGDQNGFDDCANGICSRTSTDQAGIFLSCDESGNNEGVVSGISRTEFSSPLQVTPMFRSLAAGIPTPKFSESERHFLLKTLGMESPSTKPSTNSLQPPPCKRALLGSL